LPWGNGGDCVCPGPEPLCSRTSGLRSFRHVFACIDLEPGRANYRVDTVVILAMRSTITSRGQTVVPAPIRERFGLGPSSRLEWIVDGDGSILVVPVDLDPIRAFRGSGSGGATARLLADRSLDRAKER